MNKNTKLKTDTAGLHFGLEKALKVILLLVIKPFLAYTDLIKEVKGKYSVGDEVTLADAFLIPQLYSASRFDIDVEKEFPVLTEIRSNLEILPEFKAADWSTQPDTVL